MNIASELITEKQVQAAKTNNELLEDQMFEL